jgi:hypothetical protein
MVLKVLMGSVSFRTTKWPFFFQRGPNTLPPYAAYDFRGAPELNFGPQSSSAYTDMRRRLKTCRSGRQGGTSSSHATPCTGQGPIAQRGHSPSDPMASALRGLAEGDVNLVLLVGFVAGPLRDMDPIGSSSATFVLLDHPAPTRDARGDWDWISSAVEVPEALAAKKKDILKVGEAIFVAGHLIGTGGTQAAFLAPAEMVYSDLLAGEGRWRGQER